ncbi:receptor-like protein 9DC3 [Ziziphus jujuba]|uniref:Receptor-like protein 9DC3 n=1 Tax=Ziziphus jujuba TaxID=326968 RepID=A0A6P3Z825_ZIZJJ|nr:receptor-like protein 9DC3 [Ziziphus jujuba]
MGFLMHAMKFLSLFLIIFFFFKPRLTCSSYPLSSSNVVFCPPDQSLALLRFKNTFSTNHSASSYCDDVSYPKTDYWNESVDCCLWDGVACDGDTGNVIELDLSCSWLQGVIHSNSSLFNLFHLRRLNLAYNDFVQSQVSPDFGRFSSLTHLNLSFSMLSGKLPFDLSHLSRLVSLDLTANEGLEFDTSVFKGLVKNLTQLTQLCLNSVNMSSVPPNLLMNISSSLTTLKLGFTGMLGNFPAGYVFRLPNLQYLELNANHLTGSLPESNWSTSLKTLQLRDCHFTGSLPMSIGNLTQITFIDIPSNNLSGEIPASISNLVQLEHLTLEDNTFQGQIPDAFDNLSKLNHIDLGRNKLTGKLPSSIFNLTQLLYIDFSSNQLEGPFPEYATQLSKLSRLHLSDNMLNGVIPPWLLSLPFLEYLFLRNNFLAGNISEIKTSSLLHIDLSNNNLSGPIPSSIFKLEKLTTLLLSSNSLSGVVEMDTPSKLKSLIMLGLEENLLEGRLPISPKTLAFFFASKNNFTGGVSSSICHLEQLRVLDLSHNSLAGKVPRCLGNFSNNLLELNIRMNSFQGTIPEELGTNLRSFKLNGNQFGGSLPRSLLNCSKLEVLDVGNNKLHDIFRNWLETLPELQVLVLQSNSFHGLVTSGSQANNLFPKLKIFDISRNNFSGPLPTGYFKNFKAMMDVNESKSGKLYIGGDFYNDSLELTIK